jgi:hypothetical protein
MSSDASNSREASPGSPNVVEALERMQAAFAQHKQETDAKLDQVLRLFGDKASPEKANVEKAVASADPPASDSVDKPKPAENKPSSVRTRDVLHAFPAFAGDGSILSGEKWCQIVEQEGVKRGLELSQLVEVAQAKAVGKFKLWLDKELLRMAITSDWSGLRARILAQFLPPDTEDVACSKLADMGNFADRPVNAAILDFVEWYGLSGLSDSHFVAFKKFFGLLPGEVTANIKDKNWTSVSAAMDQVEKAVADLLQWNTDPKELHMKSIKKPAPAVVAAVEVVNGPDTVGADASPDQVAAIGTRFPPRSFSRTSRDNSKGDTCYKCQKPGHLGGDCKQNKWVCGRCHREGHVRQGCRIPAYDLQGNKPAAPCSAGQVSIESPAADTKDLCPEMWKRYTNTRVEVELQGRKMEALLDGGSSFSLISLELCQQLGLKIDKSVQSKYINYNRESQQTAGFVEPRMKYLGCKYKVLLRVVDNAGWPLLLGTDFQVCAGIKVNYPEERVECDSCPIKSAPINIRKDDKTPKAPIFAVSAEPQGHETTIPAGSAISVPVLVPNIRGDFLIEPLPPPDSDAEAVQAVQRYQKGKTWILMANSSDQDLTLHGRQKLAEVCMIEPGGQVSAIDGGPAVKRPAFTAPLEKLCLAANIDTDPAAQRALLRYIEGFAKRACPDEKAAPPLAVHPPVHIDTGDAEPKFTKPSRHSLRHADTVAEQGRKWVQQGVARPTSSPWNSPTVCVSKPDGGVRVCLDLRSLNKLVKPQPFHLPNIADLLASLGGVTYMSKLDQLGAFLQIPLDDKSATKTAFTTTDGQLEMTRLPFGYVNAPAIQQTFLADVLREEIGSCVHVYLDDVLLYTTKGFGHHMQALHRVLQRLMNRGVSLKRSKCEFAVQRIDWLGFEIDTEGIRLSKSRIADLTQSPAPQNITEVESFLGKLAFVRSFLPRHAEIEIPLRKLIAKDAKFTWGKEQQKAFDKLRALAASDAVLRHPRMGVPYSIHCDASQFGCGGWLTQPDEKTGLPRAVASCSRRFNDTEMRYSTIEREAVAIKYCCDQFRLFILGEPGLVVHMDHKPLTQVLTAETADKTVSPRLVRLRQQIDPYQPTLKWIPGKENGPADAVSRSPIQPAPPDNDELAFALQERNRAAVTITPEAQLADPKVAALKQLLMTKPGDECDEQKLKQYARAAGEFIIKDNIVYYAQLPFTNMSAEGIRLVPYVPEQLRQRVVSTFHDDPRESAHLGEAKTHHRIREHFFWPGMIRSVQGHIHRCQACQLAKRERIKQAGQLKPVQTTEVLAQVSMDMLDASETTPDGHRYVIVMTDAASGFLMAVPVKDKTAKEAVRAFSRWTAVFRNPHVLITDNGTNFVKGDLPKVLASGAVHLKTSLPDRPQGNGRAERAVQVVRQLVTANSIDGDRPWDQVLPEVVTAYNASKHASTGFSPYFLLFGRKPEMAFRADNGARHLQVAELAPTPEDKAELMEWIRAVAKSNIGRAQARQKEYFDKRRKVRRFEPGAVVKLLKQPDKLKKQKKFAVPFIGPLIIDECVRDDIYRLRSMDGKLLKGRSVNVERIFPYHTNHDVDVEAPQARSLATDQKEQTTQNHAAQPAGLPDDDAESTHSEPDLETAPQVADIPEPITAPEDDQASAHEPEQQQQQQQQQQPEIHEPVTESDGEQRTTSDPDQQPESTTEPDPVPAAVTDQISPAEPEPPQQTSPDQPVRSPEPEAPPLRRSQRIRERQDRATRGVNGVLGIFAKIPWTRLRGGRSSVTPAG